MQFNTPQYKYNDHPYFIVCSFTEKSIGLKGVKEMAGVLLLLVYCSGHISTSIAC